VQLSRRRLETEWRQDEEHRQPIAQYLFAGTEQQDWDQIDRTMTTQVEFLRV
jgi:hypothetical protein